MRNKKIAIYSGDIPSTTFIENLIESVASKGNSVLIFGVLKKEIDYKSQSISIYHSPNKNWKIIPFVWWHKLKLLLTNRSNYKKLSDIIISKNLTSAKQYKLWAKYLPVVQHLPDIFHIQWAKSLNDWMFLKNVFGVKIILSLRGAHINYSPVANKQLAESYKLNFPKIDGFHAVSANIAAKAQIYGADSKKIDVIYSGLNMNSIGNKIKKRDNKVVNIISVGRFHWVKGYSIAIEAMNELVKKQIPYHYTIISSGGDSEEERYRIAETGLNNNITIQGGLSHAQVLNKIQEHDLLLLPSIEEGIANVVLEAMAVGTIVLSSNCGGMNEVIQHGTNGFLFENREVRDLVQKIEQIIYLNDTESSDIIDNAGSYIRNNHTMEILGTKMNALYEKTLNPEL